MTTSTPLTRLSFAFFLLAAACGSEAKIKPGTGPGGVLVTGTDAGSGGASGASGGASVGSGGAIAGGGDTSSGGAIAASGGMAAVDGGGTVPADDGGALPADGASGPASCRTNADCANVAGRPLCEAATGRCIACHTNAQCSNKEECTGTVCTKLPECSNSLDCASAPGGKSICDKPNGVCVQCTVDADCGTGGVCADRVCHSSCTSDNDCVGQQMLCNDTIGFNKSRCTQCVVASDCGAGEYCESGSCVPQTCKPAQQSCEGNLVVQCNESGSGVTPLTQCTLVLLSSCIVDGDNAKCVGACEDGKKDGLETDVDCGGPACSRCATGQACVLLTDCSSAKCTSSKCG